MPRTVRPVQGLSAEPPLHPTVNIDTEDLGGLWSTTITSETNRGTKPANDVRVFNFPLPPGAGVQFAFSSLSDGLAWRRQWIVASSAWTAWESFASGGGGTATVGATTNVGYTEQLTTEIYNRKRVYSLLVDMGTFPNTATKLVNHGIVGADYVWPDPTNSGFWAMASPSTINVLPHVSGSAENTIAIYATLTAAGLTTASDRTAFTGRIALRYTKTADPQLTDEQIAALQTAAGYVLPVATASVLGGVKQGAGVTISGDGTLSVANGSPFSVDMEFFSAT